MFYLWQTYRMCVRWLLKCITRPQQCPEWTIGKYLVHYQSWYLLLNTTTYFNGSFWAKKLFATCYQFKWSTKWLSCCCNVKRVIDKSLSRYLQVLSVLHSISLVFNKTNFFLHRSYVFLSNPFHGFKDSDQLSSFEYFFISGFLLFLQFYILSKQYCFFSFFYIKSTWK